MKVKKVEFGLKMEVLKISFMLSNIKEKIILIVIVGIDLMCYADNVSNLIMLREYNKNQNEQPR